MQKSMFCVAVKGFPLRLPNKLISFSRNNIRLCSNVADNPNDATSTGIRLGSTTTASVTSKNTAKPVKENKLIKVAIIGTPNAGKSSFVNQLSNRRICPTSHKVHTTRTFSKTICNKNESQMILFDTPGLVTNQEIKKHKLSSTFMSSCRHSIQHADLIAVIHDISYSHTRNALHPTVLETLQEYEKVPSILVLNKIDMLHSKRILLDLVNILTEKTLICRHRRYLPWKGSERDFIKDMERPVKYKNEKSVGWPNFSEVFMVSTLSGDGMHHVRDYLMSQSIVKPWEYERGVFTDQPAETLIIDNVRAALMDNLPNEIPYNLSVEMDYFDTRKDRIFAFVNVVCPTKRIERLVSGSKNNRMQQISESATSELVRLYRFSVSLVINVICREKTTEQQDDKDR